MKGDWDQFENQPVSIGTITSKFSNTVWILDLMSSFVLHIVAVNSDKSEIVRGEININDHNVIAI